jgi:glycosyltransferase involved in cell wall biosynthesis
MESGNSKNQSLAKPLVAICIPVYNGEKYIIEALESIHSQTYGNYECHIINNASNDKTKERVEQFIENKKRFRLHDHKDFVDLVTNWNRTVDYIPARATYFKVVQADDVLFPDSIETHVELMERFPNAGIASSYRMIGTDIYGYGIDYFKGNCQNGKEILFNHLNGSAEITGSVTQLFFRISHLKKVPGYPEIFNPEDFHVDTRLAYEMFLISDLAFAFHILSFTRRHEDAATITTVEKLNTYIHARESSLYRFKDFFPGLESRYLDVRRNYSYFLLKSRLKNRKEILDWHNRHLKRKFKLSEYLSGAFWKNRFGARLSRLTGR